MGHGAVATSSSSDGLRDEFMHPLRIAVIIAILADGCGRSDSASSIVHDAKEKTEARPPEKTREPAVEEEATAAREIKKLESDVSPGPKIAAANKSPDSFEMEQEEFYAKTNAEALAQIKDEGIRSWISKGLRAKPGKERDAVVERFRDSKSASLESLANVIEEIAGAGDVDRSRVPFIVKRMAIVVRPKGVSDAELIEMIESKTCSDYGFLWLIGNTLQRDGISWDDYIDPATLFRIAAKHPELKLMTTQVISSCHKRAKPHLPTLVKWLIESNEDDRLIYIMTISNVDPDTARFFGIRGDLTWEEIKDRAAKYLRTHSPPSI